MESHLPVAAREYRSRERHKAALSSDHPSWVAAKCTQVHLASISVNTWKINGLAVGRSFCVYVGIPESALERHDSKSIENKERAKSG